MNLTPSPMTVSSPPLSAIYSATERMSAQVLGKTLYNAPWRCEGTPSRTPGPASFTTLHSQPSPALPDSQRVPVPQSLHTALVQETTGAELSHQGQPDYLPNPPRRLLLSSQGMRTKTQASPGPAAASRGRKARSPPENRSSLKGEARGLGHLTWVSDSVSPPPSMPGQTPGLLDHISQHVFWFCLNPV